MNTNFMRLKIKERGLLRDIKKSFKAIIKEISVKKSALKSEDIIQIYFKSNKQSGIIEIKRDELQTILQLSK